MKCPFCGMDNEEGAAFCVNCRETLTYVSEDHEGSNEQGNTPVEAVQQNVPVTEEAPTELLTPPEEAAGSTVSGQYTAPASGSYASASTSGEYTSASANAGYAATGASAAAAKPEKKKKGKGVIIAIVVIVVLLLLCCCGGIVVGFIALMSEDADESVPVVEIPTIPWDWTEEETGNTPEETEPMDTEESTDNIEIPSVAVAESDYLAGYSWQGSDDSVISFYAGNEYKWVLEEDVQDDNYYAGSYELYMRENAIAYITTELADYGITQEEIESYFDSQGFYSLDNFCVFVLSNSDTVIEGEKLDASETPYYGFVSIEDRQIDVLNMNTGNYCDFVFYEGSSDPDQPSTPSDPDADWTDLSFYIEGTLVEWPITMSDLEKFGFQYPEDYEDETLDSMYYSSGFSVANDDGEKLWVSFKNYTDKDGRPMKDCLIRSIDFDTIFRLPDFSLANGLTVGSTYEEVIAIMGEADYEYDSDSSDYQIREYQVDPDEYYTNYIEFTFTNGVVDEILIVNEDDEY